MNWKASTTNVARLLYSTVMYVLSFGSTFDMFSCFILGIHRSCFILPSQLKKSRVQGHLDGLIVVAVPIM